MSEDTIAYNIIPLDAPVTTNTTTAFPEVRYFCIIHSCMLCGLSCFMTKKCEQVQAAVAALKYFPGLPKLPADFPIPATRNADMLDFLHYIFGFQVCISEKRLSSFILHMEAFFSFSLVFHFLIYNFLWPQKDSVSNQREHIVLLLANEQSRLNIPEETEPVSTKVISVSYDYFLKTLVDTK